MPRMEISQYLTLALAGSYWLKNWAEANRKLGANPDVGKWIGIYFAFGIGSSALTVVQTLILWIFCSIEVRIRRCLVFRTSSSLTRS